MSNNHWGGLGGFVVRIRIRGFHSPSLTNSHFYILFNRLAWGETSGYLSAVWQTLEANVQGAGCGRLLLHGLLRIRISRAQQGHQSLGQLLAEQQVDARVHAAVQTGQQHQNGEACSWKHKRRKWEVYLICFVVKDHFGYDLILEHHQVNSICKEPGHRLKMLALRIKFHIEINRMNEWINK